MSKPKFYFRISVSAWATRPWMADYIREALVSSGGCHEPTSPFFGLKEKDITVRSLQPAKKK